MMTMTIKHYEYQNIITLILIARTFQLCALCLSSALTCETLSTNAERVSSTVNATVSFVDGIHWPCTHELVSHVNN